MYNSLKLHSKNFHLYIFAFDKKVEEVLINLDLKNITVVSLLEFEDSELLRIKSSRSTGEYCWTCTSATILYCLEKFNLNQCTYIDADLYFYSDPKILLDEMKDKHSILITEHRYTERYDQSATSGKYCVQFISFKNNESGLRALNWWREACIEWCYARHEDGKFGDQKYLDDWTERFKGVHILNNLGGGVAPWNVQQYHFSIRDNICYLQELKGGSEEPLVFYHYHDVKFYENDTIDLTNYQISSQVKQLLYIPYVSHLIKIQMQFKFDAHGKIKAESGIIHLLRNIRRYLNGHYHKVSAKDF